MTVARFRISLLGKQDRSGFCSKSDPLDRYFHTQVSQDVRRNITTCYIIEETASDAVAGFYTLSAAEIPLSDAPEEMTRKLPRYPTLPAARVGRLAVDHRFRGMKIGSTLLADAAIRAAQDNLAVFAVVVDAKDEQAEAFYRHHGFSSYASARNKLIAPLKDLLPPSR